MADDRNRTDDIDSADRPSSDRRSDMNDEQGPAAGEDIRGEADEGEEEFEDADDLEDEDDDGSM